VEWVETTGRTVAEALDAALDQLGVDEQEAEVQILEEPQKGLFGRLRVEARVRARVRPASPRPKVERRDRRRGRNERGDNRGRGRSGSGSGGNKSGRNSRGGGGNGSAGRNGDGGRGSSGNTEVAAAAGSSSTSGSTAATGSARPGSGDAVAAQASSIATSTEAQPGPGGGNGSKRRRRRRGGSANSQGAVVANSNEATTDELRPELDIDEQRDAVEDFLTGLVEAFGRPEATVTVKADEEGTLEAAVEGDELGLLVGPKGATLQAVHELVRSMVQRRFVGQAHARVRVDVAGYRARRKEALERFTRTVADEVLSSGRAKVLDPMMASDRKVVHDVANDIEGVRTASEGEEPFRRVIIQPA
jgi:spoIIIJ-associated protein